MAESDIITIVDEKDQVIGEATIKEAREQGKIHRIARVMVENSKGQILLQRRAAIKPTWPNCWDNSAAGHVDSGESYLEAAKRELYEETGIQADKLEEMGSYYMYVKYKGYDMRRFNMVYRYKTDETPTKLQPDEVSEVRWFTVDDVKTLVKNHPDQVTDGLIDVSSRYY